DGEALFLILFAAIKRHAVGVLVEAHQSEPQIGLPGIALGIKPNQRTADHPAEPRGGARIDKSAPHHVTRYAEAVAAHMEGYVLGQEPEDANETSKRERRVQAPNPEVSRQLGQMAGVFVDALIGVSAHLSGI